MKINNLLAVCFTALTLSACHNHHNNSVDLPVVPVSTTHIKGDGTNVDTLPIPSNAVPAAPAPRRVAPAPVSTWKQSYVSAMRGLGFEAVESSRGVIVYLPNTAHFDTGSAAIKPEAEARLRQFASETNKSYVANRNVIVSGHTDSVGSSSSNQSLSSRRANAISSRLGSLGFNRSRLTSRGFGESAPRYTDAARQHLNRRVEFLVLN